MLDLADLDQICPDWRERETWACGPGPMLDAISEHCEEADLEDAAAPRAVLARARRRRRRGRHDHVPQLRQDRRGRRRHHRARGRRGGRRRHAVRLPDGHLPHLHADPRRRHDHATCATATSSASPTSRCRPASPPPSATAPSTSDETASAPDRADGHLGRQGVHPPHRGGGRADRPRARRDPRRDRGVARRRRRGVHQPDDQDPARPGRRRPGRRCFAAATRSPRGRSARRMLGAGQDPREHGDRPQRHARPVGLDERPGDPLQQLGVGHRAAGRAVEALAQLRAPPVHQRARLRQRHRLRHPPDGARAEVAPGLPRPAGLQRAARHALPVGRRAARPRHRADPQGREGPEGDEAAAQADRAQGPQPDRQGLRRLPGAERAELEDAR